MDALDFLRMLGDESMNVVLFDPPYSPRQVSECYKKLGKTVNMQTTQSSYWSNMKKEIARVLTPSGVCITFGWNSGGIGKGLGLDIEEILIVAHGGWHNDTICTVDRKTYVCNQQLNFDSENA
jgi:predicted methyltransferase